MALSQLHSPGLFLVTPNSGSFAQLWIKLELFVTQTPA